VAAESLCAAAATTTSQCTASLRDWRRGLVILTNFEISHVSLWQAPSTTRFLALLGEAPLTTSSSLFSSTVAAANSITNTTVTATGDVRKARRVSRQWSDSAIHTVLALMALNASQIVQLSEVRYQYRWFTGVTSTDTDHRLRLSAYNSRSVPSLDRALSVQRLGWLGGDSAASIALSMTATSPTTSPTGNNRNDLNDSGSSGDRNAVVEKVLFLFGDSLVGMSTARARVREHCQLVANTVAVAVLAPPPPSLHRTTAAAATSTSIAPITSTAAAVRDIQHMRFFWREEEEGAKSGAIFALSAEQSAEICGADRRSSVWPISGVTVTLSEHRALLVIAQVACSSAVDFNAASQPTYSTTTSTSTTIPVVAALDFEEKASLLIRVDNPLDDPDTWRYTTAVIPEGDLHAWRW
jgi:hypothetical protein